MKKALSILLVLVLMVGLFAGCGDKTGTPASSGPDTSTPAKPAQEGKVFNIYAWNEEFKGFFEKYFEVPEGINVNWIITPSDGGAYQEKLDQALLAQASASADEKVDLFLAEADYIIKYVESDLTMDVSTIGVKEADTMYKYTAQAASDSKGRMKGVSFQCCPAALIYRRSIAKDVIGTDDPAKVQEALSDWDKFNEVAARAKEKGYYMTASYVETYRTFSNNCSMPWVDENNKLQFDPMIKAWISQAKDFLDKGYTLSAGIWDDEKNQQMFATGKTMCFFGPAWYYNFCMGNAMDEEKGCFGDWAICQGPQAYFWGGTWLLAPVGTDNPTMVKDIMEAFTIDEEVCSNLVKNEMQFSNNSKVNQKFADDPDYGNDFLGGQNDTAVFVELAKNIKFEHKTQYDQLLNEQMAGVFLDYFLGNITEDQAYANFYTYVNEKYPAIVTPDEV
jgi:hypothetical protein